MKLFPFPLVRTAGLSFEDFDQSSKGRTDLTLITSNYIQKENSIDLKRIELIEALQQLVYLEQNNKQRKNIKKLKKNVQFKTKIYVDDSFSLIDGQINGLLSHYKNEFELHKEEIDRIKKNYIFVLEQERINLVEVFKKDELKNGLLLSSQTLLHNFTKYDCKQDVPNKKFNQLEWSMYKYASRAATKTSPFSSFTSVGVSNFNYVSRKGQISGKLAAPVSIVKFNSIILRHFIICLKVNKQYRLHFLLTRNPSITVERDYYHYLINKQNIEVFQRLKKNAVVDEIFEILQDQIQFKEVLKKLVECIDDSEDNIEFYLLDLINKGFIEMHLGFSELDEYWEQKLLNFLISVENSVVLSEKFKNLYLSKNLYKKSNCVEERGSFLSKIQSTYEDIIEFFVSKTDYKIKENTHNSILFYSGNKEFNLAPDFSFTKIKSQNIIYEDVLTSADIEIPIGHINIIVEKVNSLINATKLYTNNADDFFDPANFFRKNYGVEFVDLLTFYEDYFQDKQKDKISVDKNNDINPKTVITEQLKNIFQLRKSWENHFCPELATGYNSERSEYHFDLDLIKRTADKLNLPVDFSKNSFSSFFQLFVEDSVSGSEHLMAVCSTAFNGYGKFYGRFLNGLSAEVLHELKKSNAELIPFDCIFAENIDASIFNANHHPSIMDYEIQIPGVQNILPQSNIITLKDLQIKFDSCEERLQLYSKKNGKRVFVFDLCFQAIKSRSNLYNLLEIFSKVEIVTTSYLYNSYQVIPFKDIYNKEYKINHYPRVIFENTIVLRRSSWLIPKGCITIKDEESDCDEFLMFNLWRNSLKIPDEVFVKITSRTKPDETILKKNVKQDNYKPQYINFLSPISVRYFGKLVKKAESNFIIEEMLPNSNQLAKFNNKLNVTEFLIQWNNA